MNYEEFKEYKELENKEFPLAKKYQYNDSIFYVEPMFYTQLQGMKTLRKDDFYRIMDSIKDIVTRNKRVIFVYDMELPYIELDGYIYRELTDITDPLQIFVEDKSRGSDYGD